MKKLALYLNKHIGCTCYVPLYKGHGSDPQYLLESNIDDWWHDTQEAYNFLQQGYNISVIGLSVGGVFLLKLAQIVPIKKLIVMSVPTNRTPERLKQRLIHYAIAYKQLEGKSSKEIEEEMVIFRKMPIESFEKFQRFIDHTIYHISKITAPVAIYYGCLDDTLYENSAIFIYENVSSEQKEFKAFPNSTHLMTLGEDQESLFHEVLSFLTRSHDN